MTSREIILLILTGICFLVAVVSFILYIKRKRDILRLAESIDNYIEKGELTHFSTSDNSFAPLQNSVADLENLHQYEKQKTAIESRKTTDFIADISHQIKTPLAGLRLYVEIEENTNPSEHTKKEIQLIEKMESLVYRLLRLEKIKNDAYVMDYKFYQVKEIVDEVVSEFQPLFKNKKYSVSGNSKMRCDKAWLNEAIGNLVKNASEHTEDDGIIEINISDGDKSTTISVKDNGCGVDEKELHMLFERFHRTKNANPNSAGIGLAITKAIVEKHHGTITAENTGTGLNVVMCFPHIDGYETL